MSDQVNNADLSEPVVTVVNSIGQRLFVAVCGPLPMDEVDLPLIASKVDFQVIHCVDENEAKQALADHRHDLVAFLVSPAMEMEEQLEWLDCLQHMPARFARVVLQKKLDAKSLKYAISAGATHVLPANSTSALLRQSLANYIGLFLSRDQVQDVEQRQQLALAGLSQSEFHFNTREQACALAAHLSWLFKDQGQAAIGLTELMMNAVEHGLADIGSTLKEELLQAGKLDSEVNARVLGSTAIGHRCRCYVEQSPAHVTITIEDPGAGFDHRAHIAAGIQINSALSGRGVIMATRCFDAISYNDKGNVVCVEEKK